MKIIEVVYCGECPYRDFKVCSRTMNEIGDLKKIPEWCPLEGECQHEWSGNLFTKNYCVKCGIPKEEEE